MADFLFQLFWFSCFAYVELTTDLLVWLNQNQSNRKSAVLWYCHLLSVCVFSVLAIHVLQNWSQVQFLFGHFPLKWTSLLHLQQYISKSSNGELIQMLNWHSSWTEWNNIDTLELRRHKQRRNMYTQSSQKPKKANRLKIYACQTFRKVGYEMP